MTGGSPAVAVLGLFFCLWLALTAVCQPSNRVSARIRRWDALNLIPAWTFFAPNPGMHDLHLLYRDRLSDGSITRWREVLPHAMPWWLAPMWNPGRRHNKALLDVIKHFSQEVNIRRENPAILQLSLPYLAILNFISRIPRDYEGFTTQFLVMQSKGSAAKPECVFVSGYHAVDKV